MVRINLINADGRKLWRYHLRCAMGSAIWLTVVPVALALGISLWLLIWTGQGPDAASTVTESIAPLLAAALISGTLFADFRSGTIHFLAGQPAAVVRRAMTARFVAVVALAMLTAGISLLLLVLFMLMGGSLLGDNLSALFAGIPSVCFLAGMALVFGMLFRSPGAGFAAALLYWLMDLQTGAAASPVFSLRAGLAGKPLAPFLLEWWAEKLLLLAAAAMLLWWAQLLIKRPQPSRRGLYLGLMTFLAALVFYAFVGSAVNVAYSYARRYTGPRDLSNSLAEQMKIYSPTPVSFAFGPAFRAFISVPRAVDGVDAAMTARAAGLDALVTTWPHSIWAEPALHELCEAKTDLGAGVDEVKDLWKLADRYPGSRYAAKALETILSEETARVSDPGHHIRATQRAWLPGGPSVAVPLWVRMSAAQRLLERYPGSPGAEVAAQLYERYGSAMIRPGEMLKASLAAASVSDANQRSHWLLAAARAQFVLGKLDEAIALAAQARDSAHVGQLAENGGDAGNSGGADRAQAEALLAQIAAAQTTPQRSAP